MRAARVPRGAHRRRVRAVDLYTEVLANYGPTARSTPAGEALRGLRTVGPTCSACSSRTSPSRPRPPTARAHRPDRRAPAPADGRAGARSTGTRTRSRSTPRSPRRAWRSRRCSPRARPAWPRGGARALDPVLQAEQSWEKLVGVLERIAADTDDPRSAAVSPRRGRPRDRDERPGPRVRLRGARAPRVAGRARRRGASSRWRRSRAQSGRHADLPRR